MIFRTVALATSAALFNSHQAWADDNIASLDCFKNSRKQWLEKLDPAKLFGTKKSGPDKMPAQKPWLLSVLTAPDGTVSIKTGGKLEKEDASPLEVEISHALTKENHSKRTSQVTFGYKAADDPMNKVPARNGQTVVTETSERGVGRTFSINSQFTFDDYDLPKYTNPYWNTRIKNQNITIDINDLSSQISPCGKQQSLVNRTLADVTYALPYPASTETAGSLDFKVKFDGYFLNSDVLAIRLSNMSLSYASIGKVSDHRFHMSASLEKIEGMDPLLRGLLMIFDEDIKIEGDIHGPNLLDKYMNVSDDSSILTPFSFSIEDFRFQAKNKFGTIDIKGNAGIEFGKGRQLYQFSSYDLNVAVQNYIAQKSIIVSQKSPAFADISAMNGPFPDADAYATIDDNGTAHWHLVLDKAGNVTANDKVVPNAEALK